MKPLAFALALAGLFAAGISGAAAQNGAAGNLSADTVVARVNGEAILYSEIARTISRLPDQYRQIPLNVIFPQILEQVVNNRLIVEVARAQNLQNDAQVLQQMREFENIAIQQAYLKRAAAKQVTEESVREVYDTTVGKKSGPEEVKASHILVETEQAGRDIIAELNKGGDFAALARKHSTGPTGPSGGDLGYFTREAMVAPFSEAAFKLEIGAVAPEPVKTQFGWHVIKVVDKRRQPAPGFEQARAQIEDVLTREFITAHMLELRANAKIEVIGLPDARAGGGAGK